MATIHDLEGSDQLPWGFHDGKLVTLVVDWLRESATFDLRAQVTERQDHDRLLRVTVTGLEWLVVDPPQTRHPLFDPAREGGWDIDSRPGTAREGLPPVPEGAFVHYFWLFLRNSAIHVCARDASWEWLEDEPRASGGGGVYFPGDELPDFPKT